VTPARVSVDERFTRLFRGRAEQASLGSRHNGACTSVQPRLMLDANPLILLAAVLLLAGVLLSKTSSRLGVPSLLLFLMLGTLGGSEGLLGIEFEDWAGA
jgi:hypothetical protein